MKSISSIDSREAVLKVDRGGQLNRIEALPETVVDAVRLSQEVDLPNIPRGIERVVIAGLGGSSVGGYLLKDIEECRLVIPLEVHQDYGLPSYVDEKTLVFAVSVSGETEETLSAFDVARKKKAHIIAVASGGRLLEAASKAGVPHLRIPKTFQGVSLAVAPRSAIAYVTTPLFIVLERFDLLTLNGKKMLDAAALLRKHRNKITVDSPAESNPAKATATGIFSTMPAIYGHSYMKAAAYRMKCQLNENAKMQARVDYFPGLNHNEIVGWEAVENPELHSVVLLRCRGEVPRITERIEATKDEIIRGGVKNIHEIRGEGNSPLEEALTAIYTCDFVSLYCSVLRGVDPSPTHSIARLKGRLSERFSQLAK